MNPDAVSPAWEAAEAALPVDWQLIGVWRDQEQPGMWVAIASGPRQPDDMVTGKGDQPAEALSRLADQLRAFREPRAD